MRSTHALLALAALWATLLLAACPDDSGPPLGASCTSDSECDSGLCEADRCLDPSGDFDNDGLINSYEVFIDSDPRDADSDGDGVADGAELGDLDDPTDADGDGRPDILESATEDADRDCTADQFDPVDDDPGAYRSPLVPEVCGLTGVCAELAGDLDVACPAADDPEGQPACVYDAITGYVADEAAGDCNGVDDDCDGETDEGSEDTNDDGEADCVDDDDDGDGHLDGDDNCPLIVNIDQADADEDGIGDACDLTAGGVLLSFTASPSTVTAGLSFSVSIAVTDRAGNVAQDAPAVVTLTATDAAGQAVPLTGTLSGTTDAGTLTLDDVALERAGGPFTLVASADGLEPGFSPPISVAAAAAASYTLGGMPDTVTAGAPLSLTVTALDAFGNVAAGHADSLTVTSNDPAAVLPTAPAFTASDAGALTLPITLATASDSASVTVTSATDATLTATAEAPVVHGPAAVLAVVAEPAVAVAGQPITVTVTALDAYGNVATGYAGTLTLTTTDPAGPPPAIHAMDPATDAGVYTFSGLVFEATGSRTVTVTGDDGITGAVVVEVAYGADLALQLTGLPAAVTAGVQTSVTLTVLDAFGNPVTDFEGTVALTSTDPAATFPASLTFSAADSGRVDIAPTFFSSGSRQLTATLAGDDSVSDTVETDVTPGDPAAVAISGLPPSVVAGATSSITVTMRDDWDNLVDTFSGVVSVDVAGDEQASYPTAVDVAAGMGSFDLTLRTAGAQTVVVTEPQVTGTSATGTSVVVPASASGLIFESLTTELVAGDDLVATLVVVDAYGNRATGFTGSADLVLDPVEPQFPTTALFDASGSGGAVVSGRVVHAGLHILTATITALPNPQAVEAITVAPGQGEAIALLGMPGTVTAGTAVDLQVQIRDLYGNDTDDYVGTVAFSCTDQGCPAAVDLSDVGTAEVVATFYAAGTQSVTATGSGLTTASATATTTVDAGAAASFDVTGLAPSVTAGDQEGFTVTVFDTWGNRVRGYVGSVDFFSSDAAAVLPGPYTFTEADQGRRDFVVTLATAGDQTVEVRDDAMSGVATTAVGHAALSRLLVAPSSTMVTAGVGFDLVVTPLDAFDNVVDSVDVAVVVSTTDPRIGDLGATLVGPTTIGGYLLETAGPQTVTVSQDAPSTTASGVSPEITVVGAGPVSVAWLIAPSGGLAGAALAGFSLQLLDAYGNASPTPGVTMSLALARNPNQGRLTAGVSGTTDASGVAAFGATVIDRAGQGYVLRATSGGSLGAVDSGRFDVAWQRPVVTSGPTVTEVSRGCYRVDYAVSHPTREPVDVEVSVEVSEGVFAASGARSSSEQGLIGLPTSPGGINHSFLWDAKLDLGELDGGAGLHLRAVVEDVTSSWASTEVGLAMAPAMDPGPMKVPLLGTPRAMAVADANGDGLSDVYYAFDDGSVFGVGVMLRRPDGSFDASLAEIIDGEGVAVTSPFQAIAAGDLNGDGYADAVVAGDVLVPVYVQVEGSTLSLVEGPPIQKDEGVTTSVLLLDVDLDGDRDVVASIATESGAGIYTIENVDTYYTTASVIRLDVPIDRLVVGDINQDGRADVVAGASGMGVSALLPMYGTGEQLVEGELLDVEPFSDVALGDLDRDGVPELLTSDPDKAEILVRHIEDGAIKPEPVHLVSMEAPAARIAVGELTLDGNDELVAVNRDVKLLEWRRGSAELAFVETEPIHMDEVPVPVVTLGAEADGRALVVVGVEGEMALAYGLDVARGCQVRWDSTLASPSAQPAGDAVVVDLDRDGKPDLVQGVMDLSAPPKTAAGGLRISWGAGDGGFEATEATLDWSTPQILLAATDVVVADLDGNGLQDVASLWCEVPCEGDKTGLAIAYQVEPRGFHLAALDTDFDDNLAGLAAGDVDLDGLDDLVITYARTEGGVVLFQKPGGSELVKRSFELPTACDSVALADTDLDGDLDLFVGAESGDKVVWIENAGGLGQLEPGASEAISAPGLVGEIVAADVNVDGAADVAFLATASGGAGRAAWIIYQDPDSPGSFPSSDELPVDSASRALAVGPVAPLEQPSVWTARWATTGRGGEGWIQNSVGTFTSTGFFGGAAVQPLAVGPLRDGRARLDLAVGHEVLHGGDHPVVSGVGRLGSDLYGKASALLTEDFDLDGDADAVWGDSSTVGARVANNDKGLGLEVAQELSLGVVPDALVSLDADGDLWPDLALASDVGFEVCGGARVMVLSQVAALTFGLGEPMCLTELSDVDLLLAGDVVRDGRDELVIIDADPAKPSLVQTMTRRDKDWMGPELWRNAPIAAAGAALGALVGDPRLDLAVAGLCDTQQGLLPCLRIAEGLVLEGLATFGWGDESTDVILTPAADLEVIRVGDVHLVDTDLDGDLDVLVAVQVRDDAGLSVRYGMLHVEHPDTPMASWKTTLLGQTLTEVPWWRTAVVDVDHDAAPDVVVLTESLADAAVHAKILRFRLVPGAELAVEGPLDVLATEGHGRGLSVDDMTADGQLDIVVTPSQGPLVMVRQR